MYVNVVHVNVLQVNVLYVNVLHTSMKMYYIHVFKSERYMATVITTV